MDNQQPTGPQLMDFLNLLAISAQHEKDRLRKLQSGHFADATPEEISEQIERCAVADQQLKLALASAQFYRPEVIQ
jgi:hypothetical protein